MSGPAHVDGNARRGLWGTWLFTLLWNAVSVPLLFIIPDATARQPFARLGYLFPLVGTALFGWAGLATLRRRRFGKVWFDGALPATPGTTLTGTVHVERGSALATAPGEGGTSVRVRLTCLSRRVRRGDESEAREDIVWQEEGHVAVQNPGLPGGGFTVPVRFDVPADASPTTAERGGAGVFWVLTVEAALPGVDLRDDFDVPVVGTGMPTSDARVALRAIAGSWSPPVSLDALAATGITITPVTGGHEYHFAAARNVSFAMGMTAFTAIWTGALWLQVALGFPVVFPVLTGLVDVLLLWVTLDLWLGTRTIAVAGGTLRWRKGLLGGGRWRTMKASAVATVRTDITMSTAGRYGTPYYALRLMLHSGRRKTLADGIANKRHAEWLAAELRSALGLRAGSSSDGHAASKTLTPSTPL